VGDFVELARK
jgi:DNA repair protein RadC